jgi:hypothetical protein
MTQIGVVVMNQSDTRFTYGVGCSWRGPISKVNTTSRGLPCCPYCGGLLFEMDHESLWYMQIDAFNAKHPGYGALQTWLARRQKRHGCLPQRSDNDLNAIFDLYVAEGNEEPTGLRI